PVSWRLGILAGIFVVAVVAYLLRDAIGLHGQSIAGIIFFFGIVAAFSANLRAVNWRTIGWGIALQVLLALLVLKGRVTIGDNTYSVYAGFQRAGDVVRHFIDYSTEGAEFVFGNMADPRPPDAGGTWTRLFPGAGNYWFQFAYVALPPILFVSAFFTVLYHFGILQLLVRALAKVMVYLMNTSGAERVCVDAN